MYADVIVDISVDSIDKTYQYRIPDKLEQEAVVGAFVNVMFGNRKKCIGAYIVSISDKPKIDEKYIKDILHIDKKKNTVDALLIKTAKFIREEYGSTMNEALKCVLPIKNKIREKSNKSIKLKIDNSKVNIFLDEFKRKKHVAKYRVLSGLVAEQGQMSERIANKRYGANASVIRSLIKDGIISEFEDKDARNPIKNIDVGYAVENVLNDMQQGIVDSFFNDYNQGIKKPYLLYGITGSGKTEVYIQILKKIIEQGKQGIVLIPEIALTYQTVARFYKVFGDRVTLIHSRLSDGEKYDQYMRAKNGEVDIVIGPRSALFVPFENLGLIIIDEEHDGSYISESTPAYHSDEVAIFRAGLSDASVILGSATPSMKSYIKAKEGAYGLFTMDKRAGKAILPQVSVVDMREELKEKNRSIFSRLLREKIEDRLKKGEQTMLFINRRGYAGFVSCRSCGHVFKCDHCDVSMTAHKNHVGDVDTLVCHYCGKTIYLPERCPECGSPYIGTFGLGTQRIEDMVRREFKNARVLRMDADTTTGKLGHETILSKFRNKEADILVGTQMIVKGHDFKDVTLVGALAGDMSMFENDYKSTERTFQLLMQAAGRAGRAETPGDVVIQTYSPDNYVYNSIKANDSKLFYEKEEEFRRSLRYPPFGNILHVRLSHDSKLSGTREAQQIKDLVNEKYAGPVSVISRDFKDAPKIKDRYRYEMFIKSKDRELLKRVREEITAYGEEKRFEGYVRYEWG